MQNSIIDLLNLKGDDVIVTAYESSSDKLTVHIEKRIRPEICPECGNKLYSKGYDIRTLNHPILQDGRKVILKIKKRKYCCSSEICNYFVSDSFSFAPKGKHSTYVLPLLILKEFKNINTTAIDVAKKLNVSDTLVYNTFLDSVDFKRLPLSSVISIDEVFMNTDYNHKYAMVILDFLTGEPIDILESRREVDTAPYFSSIVEEERNRVKYLICDMYNPYIRFTKRYFPNAIAVVDCFHVIQWINDRLKTYFNSIKKKYEKIDNEQLKKNNYLTNRNYKTKKISRELYIIKKYKFFLFSKRKNIEYSLDRLYDNFLNMYLDTYQKEKLFYEIDPKFEIYRNLKEKYFEFDECAKNNPNNAIILIENLINEYKNSNEDMFVEFAGIIEKHKKYILNSYTFVTIVDSNGKSIQRRLSNGPIEQFNTKPKSLKRVSRGIRNFEYARNRILWATRSNDKIQIKTPSKKV